MIQGPALAEPLLLELARAVLERRRPPAPAREVPGVAARLPVRGRRGAARLRCRPSRCRELDAIDCRVTIVGIRNTRELSGIDPARMRPSEASRPVMERFMERSAAGELRWLVTAYPCDASPRTPSMSLAGTRTSSSGPAGCDLDDPVAAWREFAEKLQRRWPSGWPRCASCGCVAEDTDLTVGVAGRTWITVRRPTATSPTARCSPARRDATRATCGSRFPAVYGGREVDDVRLRFEDGRVVAARGRRGRGPAAQMLDDRRRRVASWASSRSAPTTTSSASPSTPFRREDRRHVPRRVGAGYPETGSTNESGLHWDMVCDLRDGGEIHADGELIYRDGRFLP